MATHIVSCCRLDTVAVLACMPALEQLALVPTVPHVPLPGVRVKHVAHHQMLSCMQLVSCFRFSAAMKRSGVLKCISFDI